MNNSALDQAAREFGAEFLDAPVAPLRAGCMDPWTGDPCPYTWDLGIGRPYRFSP